MRNPVRWLRPSTLVGLLVVAGMLAGVTPVASPATAQEATPAATPEPLYFSDTEGPAQPGGVVNYLLHW